MHGWLVVTGPDLQRAQAWLSAREDNDKNADDDRTVDFSAEETECPACLTKFATAGVTRCPECGLNFGG